MTASINNFLSAANTAFTDRGQIFRAFVVALIAKQNVLLHGPGGTAKSSMARYFFSSIQNRNWKEYMFMAGTRSSEFIPSVDPVAFRDHGITQPALTGTIVDPENPVHYAVFDELFNAPGETLAALNGVVHPIERKMPWRGQDLHTEIESIIAATNLIPKTLYGGRKDARFHAAYDRFLFRFNVEAPTSQSGLAELIRRDVNNRAATGQGMAAPSAMIDPAEIDALRVAANAVTVCDFTCKMLHETRLHAASEGYAEIGVRRVNYMVQAMQASAALDGRSRVTGEDFDFVISASAWDDPNNANKTSALLGQESPADVRCREYVTDLQRNLKDALVTAKQLKQQGVSFQQAREHCAADPTFCALVSGRQEAHQWLTHTAPEEFWRGQPEHELVAICGREDRVSKQINNQFAAIKAADPAMKQEVPG